ncbi:hypothetical protein [Actinoplanes digitatis]|uniref:hypothetical protein n=1 Tax=Actinoplanes digitatis TaxID=1868 RepID=UPI0016157DFA|nr:hypothetical protein [Actinoplanes digitatis]
MVPITLMSIAVVLVLCVGGSTAVYLAGRNAAKDLGGALATPTPTTTTEAPTITVVEPKTLGSRPKLTDPKFLAVGEQLREGPANVPGATQRIGALYGTVAKRDIVIVAAAAAPLEDPQREFETAFADGIKELKLTGVTRADPGTLGGVARCGKGEADGDRLIMCGWADEGSIGWVIWYFTSLSKAKGEFPKIRAEVEKKSN